jgi:hypothetical protein
VTFGLLISKQVRRVSSDLGSALPLSVNLTVQGKGRGSPGFTAFSRSPLCELGQLLSCEGSHSCGCIDSEESGGVRIYVVHFYVQSNHLLRSWNLRLPIYRTVLPPPAGRRLF